MRIAVTGANGFVGSGLLSYFRSKGYEPLALVRPSADTALLGDIPIRRIDYNNPSNLAELIADVDILIHNAGKTKTLSYQEMLDANLGLTQKLLDAANASPNLRQFILISSLAASRPTSPGKPVIESDPSAPLTWYGKSKLLAEQHLAKESTLPYTIIRPCPIYGPGDRDFLELARICKKGYIVKLGFKEKYSNMIHISELADLISRCMNNPQAYNQIFFAADGKTYTQTEISRAMADALNVKTMNIFIPSPIAMLAFILGDLAGKVLGKPLIVNREKMKEFMAEAWLCSIDKAKELLGYAPVPDLNKHIKETIQWYKEASWL